MLATSLSLIVIFLPIAFMGGIVGRFFSSFGLTVAFAMAMSLFVSFTLTPMLCSRFLKLEPAEAGTATRPSRSRASSTGLIDGGYGCVLRVALRFKFAGRAADDRASSPARSRSARSWASRSSRATIRASTRSPSPRPRATASSGRARLTERARSAALEAAGNRSTSSPRSARPSGGRVVKGEGDVTRGTIYVRMTDLEDARLHPVRRSSSRRATILKDYPDLRVSVNDVSAFQGGRRPQTFQVNLAGPDLNKLADYADQLDRASSRSEPGLVDLDTTLSLRKPEVQVLVDREAASDLGIPVGTIADTLRVLVGGLPVSKFRDGDEQYDVWLRAEVERPRRPIRTSTSSRFPSPTVGLVKLASLAKLVEERGPTEIERLGRERIVTVLGNPEGIALGEADRPRREDPQGDEPAAAVHATSSPARPRRWARPATTS